MGCAPTNPEVLTPGEIAKILRCSHRYVCGLVDKGLLKGYRLPGSTHRRINREDFKTFCKDNNIPLDDGVLPEQMFRAEDVARITNQPLAKVRRWIREGEIKAVISQRTPKVVMSDLLEFCNKRSIRMRLD